MSKQKIFLRLLKQHLECLLKELDQFNQLAHEAAEAEMWIRHHGKDTPPKAIDWYRQNTWLNAPGFEAERAAARAIDLCLALDNTDKDSDYYYRLLNERLELLYPGLTMPSAATEKQPVQLRIID